MCLDAFSIIEDLVNPVLPEAPGAEYQKYVTYIKCGCLAINALYMLAGKLGFQDPLAEQIILCVDLLTAIVNSGLNTIVALEELDATEWEGCDKDSTLLADTENLVEVLTAIG